jgi:hypothetical protein
MLSFRAALSHPSFIDQCWTLDMLAEKVRADEAQYAAYLEYRARVREEQMRKHQAAAAAANGPGPASGSAAAASSASEKARNRDSRFAPIRTIRKDDKQRRP